MRQLGLDYADAVRAGGGKVDVVNLPEVGIKGNSHMMMQDKNNAPIADLIEKWLVDKGLVGLTALRHALRATRRCR